ncbi:ribosomal maturation YjgA family protein [Salinimicrobium xinjiangense]|uniref:ribosomal maturation YjgA family protein n=1 Tax=Salinimicrobium xinjiangense TaxID=438596 RepID=UPI00040BE83E|nr:DUF2809 domain-containing protein [Salinimicrobium xinjiangense]
MVFTFNKKYFSAAILLFLVEVFIALYINDSWIRPYGGDFLVVFFLYSLVKSFLKISVKNAIFGVLLFSWFVEGLQAIDLLSLLGIEKNWLFVVILGSTFEWLDILIYTLAALVIFFIEDLRH